LRHSQRVLVQPFSPDASTFLRPLGPRPLRRFIPTMDALTPARRLFVPLRTMNTVASRTGLSDSRSKASDRSASNHLMAPAVALSRYPSARQASHRHAWVWGSPLASRLPGPSGRIEFTCVADQSFTSCCSPPGLAATQLHSVTGRRTCARRGLTPRCFRTLSDALAGELARRESKASEFGSHKSTHHKKTQSALSLASKRICRGVGAKSKCPVQV